MRRARQRVRGIVVAGLMLGAASAWAGGPRFITGTSGYTTAGVPMAWYTNSPMYFTDPGDLSATVTHAQADAMVAAAAAVWNIPTASVTLAKGGELAEHVEGNGMGGGTDAVFPADVEATNYASVQIPVIYDSDGSVIDMLLGSGASAPSGCRQNGVVESVDSFGSSGTIQHAVIVLNGLCVGSAPEQLTQMQYQLTRVFGRVLGLAWSQLNDNVFTGVPQPTAAQMALWPLMHPMDVICGSYSYQCMQNPFTLRPDDINALATLYPVASSGGGKTQSSLDTVSVSGTLKFPKGQGMELVDVVAYRIILGQDTGWEQYPVYSSTTGYPFQQNGGNPVSGVEPASENAGADTAADEGAWGHAVRRDRSGRRGFIFWDSVRQSAVLGRLRGGAVSAAADRDVRVDGDYGDGQYCDGIVGDDGGIGVHCVGKPVPVSGRDRGGPADAEFDRVVE